MFWDIDFTVASLAVLVILVFFYSRQIKLPIHRYRVFSELLAVLMVTLCWDFLTSWMNLHFEAYSVVLLSFINIIYYFLISYRSYVSFKYAVVISNSRISYSKANYYVTSIPFVMYSILLVVAAFSGQLFSFENGIYHTGIVYEMVMGLIFIYLGASYIVLLLNHSRFSKYECMSVTIGNFVATVGLLVRMLLPGKMIFNFFVTLSILIYYFSMQDPLYYLDHRFKFFNTDGLEAYYNENVLRNRKVYTYGFSIVSYEEIKSMHGQNTMDEALTQIGLLLRKMRFDEFGRNSGIVFFYLNSGYFALLSNNQEKLKTCRDQILKLFEKPFHCEGNDIILQHHGFFLDDADMPHSSADYTDALLALFAYAAKPESISNEKTQNDIFKHIAHERDVVNALDRAIKNDSIDVYFQPIYGIKEGRVNGAEALSRLNDPTLGFIPPSEFIEVAENKGLMDALGDSIIKKTCELIKNHDLKALGLDYINVNLSPMQFTSGDISKHFTDIVDSYGISHDFIHVEITEQANIDADLMHLRMEEMTKQGFHMALDDFGTGYSNLNRIMEFPFDVIKLDLTIVWGYFKHEKGTGTLPIMVSTFKKNDYIVTAEGVETEEMAKGLEEMGVDCLQGYWFSKAIPPEDFVEYLKKKNLSYA